MANNRMYLIHSPTGQGVFVGKRMGHGWYDVPNNLAENVRRLFEYVERESPGISDDFKIVMEDPPSVREVRDGNGENLCYILMDEDL